MADCHGTFLALANTASPSSDDCKQVFAARDYVRRVLARALPAEYAVRFVAQGSFRLRTCVRRAGLDIDDCVIIEHREGFNVTVAELHAVVFATLRNHNIAVYPRCPCLRAMFGNGVRVDLALYVQTPERATFFAHRRDGWVLTHPSYLTAWFERAAESAPQLRRLVKYYKLWSRRVTGKMPSGVVAMILFTRFYHPDIRDDIAFVKTVDAVASHLAAGGGCRRPTPPANEELLWRELTHEEGSQCIAALRSVAAIGRRALDAPAPIATALWLEVFGSAFTTSQATPTPPHEYLVDVLESVHSWEPSLLRVAPRSWTQ